jgi:hypothetical protein
MKAEEVVISPHLQIDLMIDHFMRLTKFRIKHYKSIIDSGDCYFSEKLTILAGKNESGKTSVLEALEDFHQDRTIREEAKPIEGDDKPEVTVSFTLTGSEINEVLEKADMVATFSKDVVVTITKKFGEKTYTLDDETRKVLGISNIYDTSKKQVLDSIKKVDAAIKAAGSNTKIPRSELGTGTINSLMHRVELRREDKEPRAPRVGAVVTQRAAVVQAAAVRQEPTDQTGQAPPVAQEARAPQRYRARAVTPQIPQPGEAARRRELREMATMQVAAPEAAARMARRMAPTERLANRVAQAAAIL